MREGPSIQGYMEGVNEEWDCSFNYLQGRIHLLDNDPVIAEYNQDQAISKLEKLKTVGRGNAVVLNKAYIALGDTLGFMQRYAEAIEVLKKALTGSNECGGLTVVIRAAALYALGNIRLARQQPREALDLHCQCLDILQTHDPEGFYTAISLHKVAVMKHEKGYSAKAISLLKEAVAIFESVGMVDRYTARSTFKLAQIIYEAGDIPFAGDISDSLLFFGKARTLREKITGVKRCPGESFEDYDTLVIYSHR